MKFCASCGSAIELDAAAAPVEATAVASAAVKAIPNLQKLLKPAIAIVAVIVVALIAINLFKPSKYGYSKGAVYLTYDRDNDETIVAPTWAAATRVEGSYSTLFSSLDGKSAAFTVKVSGESGYTLYYVDGKTKKVSDEVRSFMISADGNAVAYTKGDGSSTGTTDLYLYDGGKSTKIANEVIDRAISISPNGKTVGYATSKDGNVRGYIRNGKPQELGKDAIPFAVANGAKYVYYSKLSVYYVQRGMNSDKKEKLGEGLSEVLFNKDLSQIIYVSDSDDSARSFISVNGQKRISLSRQYRTYVTPANTARMSYQISASSFADTFYRDDSGGVSRINRKFETSSVVKNAGYYTLARDGKTLYYTKNNRVYKMNAFNADADPTVLVDGDLRTSNALVTSDGGIFYEDYDGLMYKKGAGKAKLITDDYTGRVLLKGKTLLYVSDYELYRSDGGKSKKVGKFDGDVQSIVSDFHSAIIRVIDDDGDEHEYFTTDGNKFELLF
jgi:hypothetical protein